MTPCKLIACSDVSKETFFLSFLLSKSYLFYLTTVRTEVYCWNGSYATIHTVGSTSLDEGSAGRRDHLTTHNIHKRRTFMTPAGFEPAVLVSKWL